MHLVKRALLLTVLMSLYSTAKAEVLIYQSKLVIKGAGGNIEYTATAQEFIVANLDSSEFSTITYGKIGGTNRYSTLSSTPIVAVVAGARGRKYTTFSAFGSDGYVYQTDFNRGRNSLQELRTGADVNVPKLFKGSGNEIDFNEPTFLFEHFRTATYAAKRTVEANDGELTVEDVTELLVAELQDKGYLPLTNAAITSAADRQNISSRQLFDAHFAKQLIRQEPAVKD